MNHQVVTVFGFLFWKYSQEFLLYFYEIIDLNEFYILLTAFELNEIFFQELDVRTPDFFLDVATENLGKTIGSIISKSYDIFCEIKPDALFILGDTNSSLCEIAAKRLKIPIFHY